jgi:CubicO group peptidase (beta-lactamase class C family)
VIGLILGCTESENTAVQSPSTFEATLTRLAEQEGLPSLVVGINEAGIPIRTFSYGSVDKNIDKPVNGETIYYLASLSKVFSAVAILQLVEEGRLDLDRDVSDYLPFDVNNPAFPEGSITCRMLLGHRSGLADKNYSVFPGQSAPPLHPAIEEILVPGSTRYEADIWRNVKPGFSYLYSNISTALLGYIVEVVSGQNYGEYCREHIFDPLGMSRTSFDLNDLDKSNFALPYINGSPVNFYSVELYPSGMLKSTLNDLTKFATAILEGGILDGTRILNESSIMDMFRLHDDDSPVGYVWFNYASLGGLWGHAGWFHGYQTMMLVDPHQNTSAIILSNTSTSPNNPILFDGSITKFIYETMSQD